MQRLFGPWFKAKLGHIIEDFDTDTVTFDVRKGSVSLTDVSLASTALQNITEHLCASAPIIARSISAHKASLQLNWGGSFLSEPVKVSFDGLSLHLEIQSAAKWDVSKVAESLTATKLDTLKMHSKLVRVGYLEGAGFVHELMATALDNLELSGSRLRCILTDSASHKLEDEEAPFTIGAGVTDVEVKIRDQSRPNIDGAVLRHVLLRQPYLFLDEGIAAFSPLDTDVVFQDCVYSTTHAHGQCSSSTSHFTYAIMRHQWILAPSSITHCEVGLLQCQKPVYVDSEINEEMLARNDGVDERDVAFLARPMHHMHSNSSSKLPSSDDQWVLPRSALIVSVKPLNLDVTARQCQLILGLAAFACLGYQSVLKGIQVGSCMPTSEELEQYGAEWLKAVVLGDGILDKEIELFEKRHSLAIIMRARDQALEHMSLDPSSVSALGRDRDTNVATADWLGKCHPTLMNAMVRTKLMGSRWVPENLQQSLMKSEQANWQETMHVVRDAMMLKNPHWQQAWAELCDAQVPKLVIGAKLGNVRVNVLLKEEAQKNRTHPIRFNMEDIVFSFIDRQSGLSLTQISLFEFRLEDNYGPQRLLGLAKSTNRVLQTPLTPVLVAPGEGWIAEARSELYFSLGQRKVKGGTDDPDGTLQLKSFGELNFYISPIQLVVVYAALLPPHVRLSLGHCFMGVPWRSCSSEAIVNMAEHGRLADAALWRTSSDGQSDNWLLMVDLEPIHVKMPVPGGEAFRASRELLKTRTSESPEACWNQVLDFCLGHVHASSTLQPRQQGGPPIGLDSSTVGSDACYDEYASRLEGFNVNRKEVRAGPSFDRTIVDATNMDVKLFICHWTKLRLPQTVMEINAPEMEVILTVADVEAFLEVVGELVWVMVDLTAHAARKAQMEAKRRLQKLARSQTTDLSKTRRPRLKGHRRIGHPAGPGGDIRLWVVVLRQGETKVKMELAGKCDRSEYLEVLVVDQELQSHVCIDGSANGIYTLKHLEAGSGGMKLYSSNRLWQTRQFERSLPTADNHVRLCWTLEPPWALGQPWLIDTLLCVSQPTVMVWWPSIRLIYKTLKQCVLQVSVVHGRLKEDPSAQLRWLLPQWFHTSLLICPDWFGFSMQIDRIQLLIPTLQSEGLHEGSSCAPLLRIRCTPRLDIDECVIARNERADKAFITELEVRASIFKTTAEFLLPQSSHASSDPWSWLHGRTAPLVLVQPFRSSLDVRLHKDRKLKIAISIEPVRICVYPATRALIMDMLLNMASVAAELVETKFRLAASACTSPVEQSEAPIDVVSMPSDATTTSLATGLTSFAWFASDADTDVPSLEAGSIWEDECDDDFVDIVRGVSVAAIDASAAVCWNREVEVVTRCSSVVLQLSDVPGGSQPLNATVVLEDTSLRCRRTHRRIAEGQERWAMRFTVMLRADALDALSSQVEPVVEPVAIDLALSSRSSEVQGSTSKTNIFPIGSLSASWLNLTLPLGVFYAAKLWLRAEEALSKAHEEEMNSPPRPRRSPNRQTSKEAVDLDAALSHSRPLMKLKNSTSKLLDKGSNSRPITPNRNSGKKAISPEVLPQLATFRREMIGCDIVNQLGQPIAVRSRDDSRWCVVNTGTLASAGPTSFELHEGVTSTSSTAAVPPLTLRGLFGDSIFEVTLHAPLQVPQFEIVQLSLPWSGGSVEKIPQTARVSRANKSQREYNPQQKLTLLLRAVPDQGGQGCSLLVTTSVVVRNNTSYSLHWGLPEVEPDRHRDLAALELDILGDSCEESMDVAEKECFLSHGAHAGKSKRSATGRWLRFNRDSTRPRISLDQRLVASGKFSLASSTRRPLPLSWMVAGSSIATASQLELGLEGSSLTQLVLPIQTITRLGCFDFSKSHREEEQRLDLSGSLLRLQDYEGNDVHVCCTITVGLLADRAHCLEIVVSSVFYLVNHLPLPFYVQSEYSKENSGTISLKERKVDAGSMVKEYIAADGVKVDFTTADGIQWKAHVKLKGSEHHDGDEEFATPAVSSMEVEEAKAQAKLSQKSPMKEKRHHQMEISLSVICSSAFDHDAVQLHHDAPDAWLETLSWFHPPEWKTYRRAVTIYARCWVYNASTVEVWFRAAGARGTLASQMELHVPEADWRILPSHLAATGKMSISTQAKARRMHLDYLRWEPRGSARRVKQIKQLNLAMSDHKKVRIAAVVDRAPLPFSKTLVIKLYDSIRIESRINTPLACNVPMRFRNIQKGIQKRLGCRNCCKKVPLVPDFSVLEQIVNVLPGRPVRLDTHAMEISFAALAMSYDNGELKTKRSNSENGDEFPSIDLASPTKLGMQTMNFLTSALPATVRNSISKALQVNLEKPISRQVRFNCSAGDRPKWLNLRISVQKLHQGAQTVIILEPGEPRYIICNQTSSQVAINQAGLPSMELLEAQAELPFTWYDPDGSMKLEVKCREVLQDSNIITSALNAINQKAHKVAGMAAIAAGWTDQDAAEDSLSVIREFDAASGHELYRIVKKRNPMRESAVPQSNAFNLRTSLTNTTLGGISNLTRGRKPTNEDMDKADKLESEGLERGDSSFYSKSDSNNSKARTSVSTTLPGIRLALQGIGISLLDASPLQIIYAAADQVIAVVAPSSVQRNSSTHATPSPQQATLPSKLGLVLRHLPALDIRASVLNLQVDSHIPGSFFTCALRPLHVRSQLWRSLESFQTSKVHRKLRSPVLKIEIDGCQLMGRRQGGGAVVVKSCRAHLDDIAVNIDEACLVALSAYYCRVAIYFHWKPFSEQEVEESEDNSPTAQVRSIEELMGSAPLPTKKPFRPSQESRTSVMANTLSLANPESPSWLVTVENEIHIKDNTSYLSIRLMESANPYVEGLQRDEQVGVLLGMLMPLYAAALFQPAMLSHRTQALLQTRVCMSLKELFKLINEHFVAPLNRKIGLFLWISFDWLGNPSKLFFGIMAGFRELFRQPYTKGLSGVPRGIEVCLCSVFGSIFDSLARIINSLFKSIDRVLRIVHTKVGMKTVRQGTLILSLARAPINKRDGLRRGALLALLILRSVALNVHEVARLFISRGREEYRCICLYFLVFAFTLILTVVLGLLEAILLFVYNVLQGIVISLYRRSAEHVSDWDPMQLNALEVPNSVRPPLPREVEQIAQHGMVAPFAYLPALVRAQMDPDEGLVPPWQWQRWKSVDEGDGEAVLSAFWCGHPDPKTTRHPNNEANVLFETESSIAMLHIKNYGDILESGRPRKPKAKFQHLWKIQKAELEKLSMRSLEPDSWEKDSVAGLLRLHILPAAAKLHKHDRHDVLFQSSHQAFRAFEILSRSFVNLSS